MRYIGACCFIMKKILIVSLLLAGLAFPVSAQPAERSSKRVDVIVDNDLCGDGDGLFHLVHQLRHDRRSPDLQSSALTISATSAIERAFA